MEVDLVLDLVPMPSTKDTPWLWNKTYWWLPSTIGSVGFLPQDESGFGGINGLYNQIPALKWVQEHITLFGGDPNKVTVFGESSGGESICMLPVAPLAKGLCQRAMMQSGECVNNPWEHGVPNNDIAFGLGLVDQLLNVTGALSVADLANPSLFSADQVQSISGPQAGWPVV